MEIEFKNLTFSYGGKKTGSAINDISASLGPGIHLLLGENGAGKTTLLHLIAGLRTPSSGKCLINGGPTGFRLPSLLSKIIYLSPGMGLPAANIDSLVKVHGQFYPSLSQEMLTENLRDFNIDPSTRFSAMSMGMRQKACVAYALALRTPVALLDEPATGLDITSKQTLSRMMARCIDPDQTVIVATHNIADLQNLFDSVIILDRGKIILADGIDSILQRVAFVNGGGTDALFTSTALGGARSIVANNGTIESDIDYQLLYTALHHSPETRESLLKHLQ